MGCPLHLVRPLGFDTDDKTLKRAGLDYWPHVNVHYHDSLAELEAANPDSRFFYLTTKSKRSYAEMEFREGDFIVFGSETKGLPETLLKANLKRTLTIPMQGPVRSLNLSSSVAIVLAEGLRQLGRMKSKI